MTAPDGQLSDELTCHRCGYDLRAHPTDGKCPECGASVAEARAEATIPRRPRWRDSDPRWRRRILAGAWVLVLMPLMDVLRSFSWASTFYVPSIFNWQGPLPLNETFICGWGWGLGVYPPLIFCIGTILLFSKEQGRRPAKLDWTRRWGVLCSYIVFLLSAAGAFFISALVLIGIAASFIAIPPKYQPPSTQFFANVGYTYMHFGPHPKAVGTLVLVAFSSIAVLLASIPLFNALRSSGSKHLAAILLAPLIAFALVHLGQIGWYGLISLRFGTAPFTDVSYYEVYFSPALLLERFINNPFGMSPGGSFIAFLAEATKWLIILTIAIWLTIAQFIAWRHCRNKNRLPRAE